MLLLTQVTFKTEEQAQAVASLFMAKDFQRKAVVRPNSSKPGYIINVSPREEFKLYGNFIGDRSAFVDVYVTEDGEVI